MCGSSSSCRNNNNWWYMPALTANFVEKRGISGGFAFNPFCSKAVIGICKFYKLYFDIRMRVKRWGSIMWNSLDTKYVWFKASITMAFLWSI